MTVLTLDNHIPTASMGFIQTPAIYNVSWNSSLLEQYIPRSASISSSIDQVLSFLISHNVIIENQKAVEDFLINNDNVIPHLYDMPEKIEYYFSNSSITLGVFAEPESEEKLELFIEVETKLSPEEANKNLSALNRNWLLSTEDNGLLEINVTLKFL